MFRTTRTTSGTGVLHWIPEKRETGKTEKSFLCVKIHKITFMLTHTNTHCMNLKMSSAGMILYCRVHKCCVNLSAAVFGL